MTFTIIYDGIAYDAPIISKDGSFSLEGWLQFEPEVPWLAYYLEYPDRRSSLVEHNNIPFLTHPEGELATPLTSPKSQYFSTPSPSDVLQLTFEAGQLFVQGKSILDYLHPLDF